MSNRGSRGLSNPYEHVSGMVRYLPVVSGYHRFRRIAMWSRSIRTVEHVRAGLVKRPSIPTERFIIPDEHCSRPAGVFCLFHGCVPMWITGITAKATFRPVDNKQSCCCSYGAHRSAFILRITGIYVSGTTFVVCF